VNNAGINGQSAPIGEYSLESWHRVIDVDLNGLFYSLRYEIPAMLERGGGSIVNLSSVLGTVGATNLSAYIAAKHGVNGLTKAAALDYARKGIRVNCVAPSFVETPLLGELGKVTRAAFSQMQPMRRIGQPEEVASLVTFLLSDAAAYITGSVYAIDGGYTTP
ncbi:MAG: SDR family NAD(P)-dependent oxidoreductase, partial [Dehalococcoidia bacterium]